MKKTIIPVALVAILAIAIISITKIGQQQVDETQAIDIIDNPESIIAVQSVTDNDDIAAVAGTRSKTIAWEARNFPANAGVDINLLRKVSDSPASYVFVRKIVANTNNDGSEIWTPTSDEKGSDLYIEVTCASETQFDKGCQSSNTPVKAN